MALSIIPEETTCYLTVTFKDKNGAAQAPTSATWLVIDLDSGTVVQTEANITPISSAPEISIPPAANAILNDAHAYETRRVIIQASYGTSDGVNGQYDYLVKNLSQVT